jgi:hypothetical protein
MKILLAIDGSPCSDKAVEELATHAKCSVEVVRCHNGNGAATEKPNTAKKQEQ